MNEDLTYTGFFTAEHREAGNLSLQLHQRVTKFSEANRSGNWYFGTVTVSKDGTYVELDIKQAYTVGFLWDIQSYADMQDVKYLVYIEDPEIVMRWSWSKFKNIAHSVYTPSTKYIVEDVDNYKSIHRYFNHTVEVIHVS